MKSTIPFLLTVALAPFITQSATVTVPWGTLELKEEATAYEGTIVPQDLSDPIIIPHTLGHLNRIATTIDGKSKSLAFQIDRATNKVALILPAHTRPLAKLPIRLEVGQNSRQSPAGRIVLTAKDAAIEGKTAKLEINPGNLRVGFWTNPKDSLAWTYKASRPGRYRALLTYSKAGKSEVNMRLNVAQSLANVSITATGSWYHYQTVDLGPVYIPKSGETPIRLQCRDETLDGAVINFKALTLLPTGEGHPVQQTVDSAVTLNASDVTIQGVKVQYERLPHKNTVGYWINVSDWVFWDFAVNRPGTFAVEILQGCGTGQGGSEVLLEVGENRLPFRVEETGHFQNFVPRYIGQITLPRPDTYRLAIKPQRIAANAVMDLRKIRLIPVAETK